MCSTDFGEVIKDSKMILHVTPSKFTRSTFKQYKEYVGNKPIIICSKGFEKETLETLDEVILEEMPQQKLVHYQAQVMQKKFYSNTNSTCNCIKTSKYFKNGTRCIYVRKNEDIYIK